MWINALQCEARGRAGGGAGRDARGAGLVSKENQIKTFLAMQFATRIL